MKQKTVPPQGALCVHVCKREEKKEGERWERRGEKENHSTRKSSWFKVKMSECR